MTLISAICSSVLVSSALFSTQIFASDLDKCLQNIAAGVNDCRNLNFEGQELNNTMFPKGNVSNINFSGSNFTDTNLNLQGDNINFSDTTFGTSDVCKNKPLDGRTFLCKSKQNISGNHLNFTGSRFYPTLIWSDDIDHSRVNSISIAGDSLDFSKCQFAVMSPHVSGTHIWFKRSLFMRGKLPVLGDISIDGSDLLLGYKTPFTGDDAPYDYAAPKEIRSISVTNSRVFLGLVQLSEYDRGYSMRMDFTNSEVVGLIQHNPHLPNAQMGRSVFMNTDVSKLTCDKPIFKSMDVITNDYEKLVKTSNCFIPVNN